MAKAAKSRKPVYLLVFLFLILGVLSARMWIMAVPYRPHIIIIGVDTLRADHLGSYGYHRDTSPNIDGLAAKGTVFTNCLCPIPRTTQSVASIMTGRYPQTNGCRNLLDKLPDEEITLAEVLRSFGYITISVQGNSILDGKVDQGFDIVQTAPAPENDIGFWNAEQVNRITLKLLNRLKDKKEPVFLWVFYQDPHTPYSPPEIFFDKEYEGKFKNELINTEDNSDLYFNNKMTPREREHAVALYDSEIRYMDLHLGLLLAKLDKLLPDALVIFTADHGENLGERDYYYNHGDILDQASLRVPLIIKGIEFKEKRQDRLVRLIDIMPTILGRLEIDVPEARFEGVDLSASEKEGEQAVYAFSETGRALHRDVFTRGFKFLPGIKGRSRSVDFKNWRGIMTPKADGNIYELYDLEKDPGQTMNVFPHPEGDRLFEVLESWMGSSSNIPEKKTLSREDEEKLRALGYL